MLSETTKDYATYHEQVVAACVDLMHNHCRNDDGSIMTDDQLRQFFGVVCSYEEEFKENMPPKDVAEAQWEAIT